MTQRILYAAFGYGRGHATRAATVLSALVDHDVMICTSGDALELLRSAGHPVRAIPAMRYAYHNGRTSIARTVVHNLGTAYDLFHDGPRFQDLVASVRAFAPDLAICDAEPWGHRVAARLGVPRISFDHYGILAYCRPPLGGASWLDYQRDVLVYRALMGEPDRALVSSFYHCEPTRAGVRCIGAMLRDEVYATTPSCGEHLLVYLNNGVHQFSRGIETALLRCGLPVVVYGTRRVGVAGRLRFAAPSNHGFLADLAACRAVISTAGNQLVAEAMYFGKPVLVMPECSVEQRINAAAVARLGIGRAVDAVTVEAIEQLLADEHLHRERARARSRDGRGEAFAALDAMTRELTGRALLPALDKQAAA